MIATFLRSLFVGEVREFSRQSQDQVNSVASSVRLLDRQRAEGRGVTVGIGRSSRLLLPDFLVPAETAITPHWEADYRAHSTPHQLSCLCARSR